nr:GNAT family N-acetyltransferase [Cytophagales bacterium]
MSLVKNSAKLHDVTVRRHLLPGDIGNVIHLHGRLYHEEFGFGLGFEQYVAESFAEFTGDFKEGLDQVWVCEFGEQLAGFLSLVHRGPEVAQLRYFIIAPPFRGIGLGKKLISEFMEVATAKKYHKIFLWTTVPLRTAAAIYQKLGFQLVLEQASTSFGVPLIEQKYELTLNHKL